MKVALRKVRKPKKWSNDIKSVSICDEDGMTVSRISWSDDGIRVKHLRGYNTITYELPVMGQHRPAGEPIKDTWCTNCKVTHGEWDGYRVVCGQCGGLLVRSPPVLRKPGKRGRPPNYNNPRCEFCNYFPIRKDGTRRMKKGQLVQRFICVKCGHMTHEEIAG